MTTRTRPTSAYAAHAQAINDLVERVQDAMIDCTLADHADVDRIASAREHMVRAAVILGGVSEDEAREKHGVAL